MSIAYRRKAKVMKALGYALVYLPLEIAIALAALGLISVGMLLPALAAFGGLATLIGLMTLGASMVKKAER